MHRVKSGVPLVLGLVVLIVACGPTEIGDSGNAVKQFYGHLNGGDRNAAMALYSNDVREMLQGADGQPDENFAAWVDKETRGNTIDQVKIVKEDVDDGAGTATVVFELVYAGGAKDRRTVAMTREGGTWKLGYIDPG